MAGSPHEEIDAQDALNFLTSKDYHTQRFSTDCVGSSDSETPSSGFFFAHPWQLEKLERHEWPALMDSTHNTTRYDWRVFTLYIRDKFGSWDVDAHFYVSHEDIITIAEALQTVRRFGSKWEPRYILCDNSAAESAAEIAAVGIWRSRELHVVNSSATLSCALFILCVHG